MDKVAYFIHLNRHTIPGSYAFFQHNVFDDECNSNDIQIYDNYESPIVYFKYGMKQGNVMEVKGICGNYFWLVKLFDTVT